MAEIIRLNERRLDDTKMRSGRRHAEDGGDAEILLFTGVQYQRLDLSDGTDHHANRPVRRSGGKGKKH